ncbi:MAG: FAD-dependent oxidoreductase [Pseudomonadota bacterium]
MNKKQKIAIIGSGISGLSAAYMLHKQHDIALFEKNDYLGGHSRTIEVPTENGKIAVDTGFIVLNHRNYPLLTKLFKEINVKIVKSDMSFGATIDDGAFEYGTQHLYNIFAQKSNIFKIKFWRMIYDLFKFQRKAYNYIDADPTLTLGQCLDEIGLGEWFRRYFILAMGGAIWSMSLKKMLDFPARTFIHFFDNHGLLTINDQPQWYTVQGGSREYVKRLTASFADNIKLNCGVKKVIRESEKVTLIDHHDQHYDFDQVVFACHSDQALSMIDNPTEDEHNIIGNMTYSRNQIYVHKDESFMPKRKAAWASWVYLLEEKIDVRSNMCLSYWMNNLQPLETDTQIFVTLNPARKPAEEHLFDEYIFEHPVFDEKAIEAQGRIDGIQGKDRFWFCGAYQRYGFHEDGLLSSVNMVKKMGIKPNWV